MATRSALHYENRINILKARDPVGNSKLIKKLERRIRLTGN